MAKDLAKDKDLAQPSRHSVTVDARPLFLSEAVLAASQEAARQLRTSDPLSPKSSVPVERYPHC